jgi:hypothetical protein
MSRNHWLASVAMLILSAAPALAQKADTTPHGQLTLQESQIPKFDDPIPNTVGNLIVSAQAVPVGQYWLGVYCSPVPAELRSHLNLPEKQGVLVLSVTKDSPAMKAGLAQYDVLVRVGGKPLAEPRDLLAAIEAAKETKLKIDLLRGGKPNTIEVTPAKRPAQVGGTLLQADQADWDTVQRWVESMTPGQQGGDARQTYQFRLFHPGAIVPKSVLILKALPKNMSIVITKEGDQPAKIVVKRDIDKWELTEKELDKLPADVRPHVERILGRGLFGVIERPLLPPNLTTPNAAPPAAGAYNLPVPPPVMMYTQPFSGGLDARIEKRFEEMNRRMDKLLKMMEEMNQTRLHPAAPEHHGEK